jgi:hypothetical protein
MFDAQDVMWEHEPRRFADTNDTYLPDFYTVWPSGRGEYVEAKPYEILMDKAKLDAALNKMTIIWASESAHLRLDLLIWDRSLNKYRWSGLLSAQPNTAPLLWNVKLADFHAWFHYKANQ